VCHFVLAMREMVVNQRLEKLVWQWSDQLCGDLTQYIVKDTLRLLNLRDINEEFLKNIYVNKVQAFFFFFFFSFSFNQRLNVIPLRQQFLRV
jgi:hypothetical protein